MKELKEPFVFGETYLINQHQAAKDRFFSFGPEKVTDHVYIYQMKNGYLIYKEECLDGDDGNAHLVFSISKHQL